MANRAPAALEEEVVVVKPAKKNRARKPAPKGARKRSPVSIPKKPAAGKRPSGLDLAARVLEEAGEPLNARQITELVVRAGWKTNGATPEATINAAIVREIARKGSASRFARHARGLFVSNGKTR